MTDEQFRALHAELRRISIVLGVIAGAVVIIGIAAL